MKRFYWLKDQNDRNAIIFEHCMCKVKSKKASNTKEQRVKTAFMSRPLY